MLTLVTWQYVDTLSYSKLNGKEGISLQKPVASGFQSEDFRG